MVDVGDGGVDLLAARDVEDVDVARFRAVLRKRDGDLRSIERGHPEVDGGPAARVDDVRIDDGARRLGMLEVEQHDERLLLPGVELLGEDAPLPIDDGEEVGAGLAHERVDPLAERVAPGDVVEKGARRRVLRLAPLLHLGVLVVLQPAVVVADFDAVVALDRGLLRCGGQSENGGEQMREDHEWDITANTGARRRTVRSRGRARRTASSRGKTSSAV